MTGSSKVDTTSINAKLYDWFRVYKDIIKLKKVRKNDRSDRPINSRSSLKE